MKKELEEVHGIAMFLVDKIEKLIQMEMKE